MKKIIAALLGCALGASISAFVTHKITRNKYYKLSDKELKDQSNYYENLISQYKEQINNLQFETKAVEEQKAVEKPEQKKAGRPKKETKMPLEEKASIVKPTADEVKEYMDYTKRYKSEEVEEVSKGNRGLSIERGIENNPIEIIDYENYGDKLYNYYKNTLYYYADGILADESDNVVCDIAGTIGTEALKHFGENDDADAVFVRNHRLEEDYEIRLCLRNFSDLQSQKGESQSPEDE